MARAFAAASTQFLQTSTAPVTGAPFTISCWAKSNDITGRYVVVSLGDTAGDVDFWILSFRGDASDNVEFQIQDTTAVYATSTTTFSANTWHHLAAVEAAVNSHAVYLDGGGKGTDATNKTPDSVDAMGVGRLTRATPALYLDGSVAELCIWNVALSDGQIASLAAGAYAPSVEPFSIVGYWPLGGRFAETDNDAWNTGNHLTAFNSPTWVDHPGGLIYPGDMLFVPQAAAAPTFGGVNQIIGGGIVAA